MSTAKKVIIIVVAVVVVAAIGVAGFAWAQQKDKNEEIATKSATVLVNGLKVENEALTRGTTLTVTGTQGDYYQATVSSTASDSATQAVSILVPKAYVRLASEAAPASWTGYAAEGAKIYKTVALSGTEVAALEKDAEVTVEDSFADMLYVKTADGKQGYAPATSINKEKSADEESDDQESSSAAGSYSSSYSSSNYSYYYEESSSDYYDGGGSSSSGGGESGGSSSGGSSSGGSSSGTDGGDISLNSILSSAAKTALGVQVAEAATTSPSASSTTTSASASATVLGDGVMSYLGIFDRGDIIQVRASSSPSSSSATNMATSDTSSETVECVLGDVSKPIEKRLVRIEGEAEYTPWTGYATEDAPLYADYTMTTVVKNLPLNTELRIVDNLTSCYVVDSGGSYYYVPNKCVGTLKAEEAKEETEETSDNSGNSSTTSTYSYSSSSDYAYSDYGSYESGGDSGSGGSSEGGSSGSGGSSSGGSSGGEEWTEPAL